MNELEETLQRMETNLDGLAPLNFGIWQRNAERLLKEYKGEDIADYKVFYNSLVERAKRRGIV
jgi:hypothetical protein